MNSNNANKNSKNVHKVATGQEPDKLGPIDRKLDAQALKEIDAWLQGKDLKVSTFSKADYAPPAKASEAKEARTKLHLTQPSFAKAIGVTAATVRSWEQGKRSPDGMASKVLRALIKRPDILKVLVEA